MKRGVLSEGNETQPDFGSQVKELRNIISSTIVSSVNEMFSQDEDLQIADYTLKIDSTGHLQIMDVQTKGNDLEANARAARILNHRISDEMQEMAKETGLAILDAHDDEHGDVKEYRHEVIIPTGFKTEYQIESQEADEAALREIATLTNDIGAFLSDFFGKTWNINDPFTLVFHSNEFQLLDADFLSQTDSEAVEKVLEDLNKFLIADETEDDSDDKLPGKYPPDMGDKLMALKESLEKLHDKSRFPKEGILFTF
jgi:hypothetical protein